MEDHTRSSGRITLSSSEHKALGRRVLALDRWSGIAAADGAYLIKVKRFDGGEYTFETFDLREIDDWTDEERQVVDDLLAAGGFRIVPHVVKDDYVEGEEGDPLCISRGFRRTGHHLYADAEDRFVFAKHRCERGEGRDRQKVLMPATWTGEDWQWELGPALRETMSRPIYNLPEVLKYGGLTVIFVEGEKVVDALRTEAHLWNRQFALNQRAVFTTASDSVGGLRKTDLAVLRGRRVIVVGDRDGAGQNWAIAAIEHLHEQAVDDVYRYHWPEDSPQFYGLRGVNDLADELPEWFTPDYLARNLEPSPRVFDKIYKVEHEDAPEEELSSEGDLVEEPATGERGAAAARTGKKRRKKVVELHQRDHPYYDGPGSDDPGMVVTDHFVKGLYYVEQQGIFVNARARHRAQPARNTAIPKRQMTEYGVRHGYQGNLFNDALRRTTRLDRTVLDMTTRVDRNRSVLVEQGGRIYNFFEPTLIRPIPPSPKREALWMGHLQYLCNGDAAQVQHVIDFFHHTVAHPEVKITHMLVFVGEQGIGKSIMVEWFESIVSAEEIGQSDLESAKNEWAENKLGFLAELEIAQKKLEALVKRLTAEKGIWIDMKYGAKFRAYPMTNFVLTTNVEKFAKLTPDDRRFFVVVCDGARKDPDYYNRLAELALYPAEFMGFLEKHKSGAFNPKAPPPMTEAKREIVEDSWPEAADWLRAFLRSRWGNSTVEGRGFFTADMLSDWLAAQQVFRTRIEQERKTAESKIESKKKEMSRHLKTYFPTWQKDRRRLRPGRDQETFYYDTSRFASFEQARSDYEVCSPYYPGDDLTLRQWREDGGIGNRWDARDADRGSWDGGDRLDDPGDIPF